MSKYTLLLEWVAKVSRTGDVGRVKDEQWMKLVRQWWLEEAIYNTEKNRGNQLSPAALVWLTLHMADVIIEEERGLDDERQADEKEEAEFDIDQELETLQLADHDQLQPIDRKFFDFYSRSTLHMGPLNQWVTCYVGRVFEWSQWYQYEQPWPSSLLLAEWSALADRWLAAARQLVDQRRTDTAFNRQYRQLLRTSYVREGYGAGTRSEGDRVLRQDPLTGEMKLTLDERNSMTKHLEWATEGRWDELDLHERDVWLILSLQSMFDGRLVDPGHFRELYLFWTSDRGIACRHEILGIRRLYNERAPPMIVVSRPWSRRVARCQWAVWDRSDREFYPCEDLQQVMTVWLWLVESKGGGKVRGVSMRM